MHSSGREVINVEESEKAAHQLLLFEDLLFRALLLAWRPGLPRVRFVRCVLLDPLEASHQQKCMGELGEYGTGRDSDWVEPGTCV